MRFLQKRDLGFDQEQVINLYLPDPDDTLSRKSIKPFVDELRQRSEIKSASVGSGIYDPNTILPAASTLIEGNGKKRELMTNYLFIEEHFVPLLQLKLKEGRNLSADFGTDVQQGFLVNEAFVKQAGWTQAVGQDIEGFGHKGKVVGVLKNFHYKSLHSPIEPVVMIWNTFPASTLIVKLKPGSLPVLNKLWPKYFPETPLNYSFMDSAFGILYKADQVRMTLFNYFTLLAVFISMLGLYGLISMVSIQRTREIGIRKAIGASVVNIVALLSKDFVKLAIVAFAIAIPFAWYFMDRWLLDFAYRVDLEWWMFVLGGFLSLIIALATISYESFKAALLNPVESLRSE
ncbi:ABC transporter permease [Dyadobacter bucti]|uniref:ABC transporter permease n=1 Tax=Dyadobacter bucti TaxID=2572203 RepID=UPI003F71A549